MTEIFKDYYYLLGLNKEASADDIKSRVKSLFKKFHPDKSDGANEEEVKQFLLKIGSKFTMEDDLTTLEKKKTFITKLLNEATEALLKSEGKNRADYDSAYDEYYSICNDDEPDYEQTVEELKQIIIDLFNNIDDSITNKEDYLSNLFIQCYKGKINQEEYDDKLEELIRLIDEDVNIIEVTLEQASIYQLNNILTSEIVHLNLKLEYLREFKARINISFNEAKEYVRREFKKVELKENFPELIISIEKLLEAIDNLLIKSYDMYHQKSELNFEHLKRLYSILDRNVKKAVSYIEEASNFSGEEDIANYVNAVKDLLSRATIKNIIVMSKNIADRMCEIVGSLFAIKNSYADNEFLNEIAVFEELIAFLNATDIDGLRGKAYDDFRDYLVTTFDRLEIKLNTRSNWELEYTGHKYQTIYKEDLGNNTYTSIPIKDIIKKLLDCLSTIGYEYEKEINKNDKMDIIREHINMGYEIEKMYLEKFLITLFSGSRTMSYSDGAMFEASRTLSSDLDLSEFERYISERLGNIPSTYLLQYFKFIDLGYMFEGNMNFDRAMELLKMRNEQVADYEKIDNSILANMYIAIGAVRILINEYIVMKLFPRIAREANIRNADMQELLVEYALDSQLEGPLLAVSTDFREYMGRLNNSQLVGKISFVSPYMKKIK